MERANRIAALRAKIGGRHGSLDERETAKRNRRNGIIGVVVIIASLAGTAMAYLNPADEAGYTAHMPNSAGLRAGDQVRVAGIAVGKVTTVRLDGALVEMKFDVENSVQVGSDSTLDIKLLTPLGGHYVALDPKGGMPLGRNGIPPSRVTLPFEVNDIIQAATPVVKKVDGQVIHDTFAEVANAANRYPDAIRNLLQSADTLTESMSKSTIDFHRGLDFVNNGLRAMTNGRAQLIALFEQFDILGKMYTSKAVDIVEFFGLIKELARLLDRLTVWYGRDVAPVAEGIEDISDTLAAHPEQWGQALDGLGQTLNIIGPMLSGNGVVFDEHNRLVPGQDLCLPNIMKAC
ncbi:MlaD family protein [Mycolicibacterium sphagni]|uniref:MlaD family protein n=1 Tax=Mycolicibacterium sphagni TaxID=1786 RepID=UPI0021F36ECA|nr:MlaD family protein [Mycolicibacterium sphagni]MCV7178565.1 MCE family protein [Mycolicibacterium sphagni]